MEVALLMFAGGVAAGVFGSLLGLGGGILIVPLLSFGFELPLREAVGISLICVIMTSGASAGVFLERRVANLRLGMLLELFTATGALVGGLVAFRLDERVIAGLFAALLLYVSVTMVRRSEPATVTFSTTDPRVADEGLDARRRTIVANLSGPDYVVGRLVPGALGSIVAGVVSALLGVGGGIVKVPVMHLVMGVPLRVATATSNLMIGITASTGAIIYLLRGGLAPYAAGPTAAGVFLGASIGSRIAHRVNGRLLRWLFVAVLLYTAIEMARRAAGLA